MNQNTGLQARITMHPLYFIAFFVLSILKLTHVINLPWIWVTAVIWIPGSFACLILIGLLIYNYFKKEW